MRVQIGIRESWGLRAQSPGSSNQGRTMGWAFLIAIVVIIWASKDIDSYWD